MKKLIRQIVHIFSFHSFLATLIAGTVLVAVLLGLNGFSLADGLIVAGLVVAAALLWGRLHARQSAGLPTSSSEFLHTLSHERKYSLLAFESEFCLASVGVGKQLRDLEAAHPDRFQMYCLSVHQDPGKTLFQRYDGMVTPTYVLLSPDGDVVMEWPLVLPIQRVTYAVTR